MEDAAEASNPPTVYVHSKSTSTVQVMLISSRNIVSLIPDLIAFTLSLQITLFLIFFLYLIRPRPIRVVKKTEVKNPSRRSLQNLENCELFLFLMVNHMYDNKSTLMIYPCELYTCIIHNLSRSKLFSWTF